MARTGKNMIPEHSKKEKKNSFVNNTNVSFCVFIFKKRNIKYQDRSLNLTIIFGSFIINLKQEI